MDPIHECEQPKTPSFTPSHVRPSTIAWGDNESLRIQDILGEVRMLVAI